MSTSRDITKERKRDSGLSINKRGKRFYSWSTPAWVSACLPVSPENAGRTSTSEWQSVVCATQCLQQRHIWFTGKGEKKAARRKFQFLSSRVFCSSQKMKAGILHCTFLVLEGKRPKICDFHICVNTAEFFKATAKTGLVFLPAFSML